MVGANVSVMEEQVTEVEGEVGTLPGAFKKVFRTMSVPGFLNVSIHIICHPSIIKIILIIRILIFLFRNLQAQEGNHKGIKTLPVYLGQTNILNLSLSSKRETLVWIS